MLDVKLPAALQGRFTVHPNGKGLVAPGTSITDEVYVGADSVIMGGTYSGHVRITGESVVVNSTLHGNSSDQQISVSGSYLCGAQFRGTGVAIKGSQLTNVTYKPGGDLDYGVTITIGDSVLTNAALESKIEANFTVIIDCEVTNSTIAGCTVAAVLPSHGAKTTAIVKGSIITTIGFHTIGFGSGGFTIQALSDTPIPA